MEPIIVAIVSALTSVGVALVGAWVARRKGLPGINAEIEQRNAELIKLLEGQVGALRTENATLTAKLETSLEENQDLRRRVTDAEADLLALYRKTGKQPPPRLSRTTRR